MRIYAGQQPKWFFCISYKSADFVKRLVTPFHNMGRNITTDNWFTDYDLVTYLTEKKLTLVETLKKDRVPSKFKNTKDREQYTNFFGFRKETTLVSYTPKSKKIVVLISSAHDDSTIHAETGEKNIPEIITYYNRTKLDVDTVDKLHAAHNVVRNTKKWHLPAAPPAIESSGSMIQLTQSIIKDLTEKFRELTNLSHCILPIKLIVFMYFGSFTTNICAK